MKRACPSNITDKFLKFLSESDDLDQLKEIMLNIDDIFTYRFGAIDLRDIRMSKYFDILKPLEIEYNCIKSIISHL